MVHVHIGLKSLTDCTSLDVGRCVSEKLKWWSSFPGGAPIVGKDRTQKHMHNSDKAGIQTARLTDTVSDSKSDNI